MKGNTLIRLSVVIGIVAIACNASGALSVDEQVKMLAERYRQVEDQLARSIRYTSKDESGGATTVRQEWYNGAEDLIKVAVERTDASGRELTEYIPHDLDSDFGWRGLFMLTRKETQSPDGGMQVEESRKYFGETEKGNHQLIRELRKSARFKPGELTDTVHVPNVVVDLSEENKSDSGGAEEFLGGEPHELAPALRKAGPPQFFDPFAGIQGESDKFRVIHGSASPDGRFASAMGLPPGQSDWDALYEDESYFYENGARDYDVPNYIIDLAGKKILGKTGCHYFGTKRRYNHQQCILRWSPDSLKFVQLWDDKWSSTECVAGKISPGPKLAGAVDLDKAIGKKTYAFVKKRFDSENGAGELSLQISKVSNDGTIDLEASEQCRFGDCRGETIFKVDERLRLSDGPQGPHLEILKMRRLPND